MKFEAPSEECNERSRNVHEHKGGEPRRHGRLARVRAEGDARATKFEALSEECNERSRNVCENKGRQGTEVAGRLAHVRGQMPHGRDARATISAAVAREQCRENTTNEAGMCMKTQG